MSTSVLGREPTLILQAISAVLGILVATKLQGLSAEQAALIIAVLSAGFGVVNAAVVRPLVPTAFVGFVGAGAALLAGYGLDVSQSTVGAVQAAVVAVLALLARGQVTPASNATRNADGTYTVGSARAGRQDFAL